LPVAAQGPVASALGRADRAYWVNGLSARNPAQDLRFAFSSSGALVRTRGVSERLSLIGFGRGGAVRPLGAGEPVASGNRVSYDLGSVREWFANGPLGLEQGFDVARRPAGSGGALEFRVSLTGSLRARVSGGAITLSGRGVSLRYTGLVATDALGRRLPASMALQGGRVIVSVDARGARYPVSVDPIIQQQAELASKDGTTNDGFGNSVAVSGNTIVVGAPYMGVGGGSEGFGPGAVYVFTAPSAGDWSAATESAELTVAGDTTAPADLGSSVAISGDTIYAGAPGEGVSGTTTGAVYVFDEPNGGWAKEPAAPNANQNSVLTITSGSVGDALGSSISASGGTVVASAPEEQVGSNPGQGAVYVFEEPPTGWGTGGTSVAELTASDGDADNQLGTAVATDGNTIVAGVSANESTDKPVYVWSMPPSGWNHEPSAPAATQTAELTASDGHAGNGLGSSVAVSGDTIAAGALNHGISPSFGQGAVYVWTMPASGWAAATGAAADQAAELTASDAERGNTLGVSVAIDGNAVIAGADSQDDGGGPGNRDGAVYVFVEPAAGWKSEPATPHANETDELTASDGAPGDFLGGSVAADGATIVSGASDHKVGDNMYQGAAYVFNVAGLGGATVAPANTALPVISGTAKAGSTLACSTGSWTQDPSSFKYQWSRDGTPIVGATGASYKVQASDEQLKLTCTVIASNAKGPSSPATSKGVSVPVPHVAKCPAASGKLSGGTLGLLSLGMTRAQAVHAFKRSSSRGSKYKVFFCLTPNGVRVGLGSPALLKTLPKRERGKYSDRVVWVSTSSAYYAVKGIRAGATVAAAGKKLKLESPFHIGLNFWYLAPDGGSVAILKVRGGVVEELGIGDKVLLQGRKAQRAFLNSFS
jgi:FG-GAP repeat